MQAMQEDQIAAFVSCPAVVTRQAAAGSLKYRGYSILLHNEELTS